MKRPLLNIYHRLLFKYRAHRAIGVVYRLNLIKKTKQLKKKAWSLAKLTLILNKIT